MRMGPSPSELPFARTAAALAASRLGWPSTSALPASRIPEDVSGGAPGFVGRCLYRPVAAGEKLETGQPDDKRNGRERNQNHLRHIDIHGHLLGTLIVSRARRRCRKLLDTLDASP